MDSRLTLASRMPLPSESYKRNITATCRHQRDINANKCHRHRHQHHHLSSSSPTRTLVMELLHRRHTHSSHYCRLINDFIFGEKPQKKNAGCILIHFLLSLISPHAFSHHFYSFPHFLYSS